MSISLRPIAMMPARMVEDPIVRSNDELLLCIANFLERIRLEQKETFICHFEGSPIGALQIRLRTGERDMGNTEWYARHTILDSPVTAFALLPYIVAARYALQVRHREIDTEAGAADQWSYVSEDRAIRAYVILPKDPRFGLLAERVKALVCDRMGLLVQAKRTLENDSSVLQRFYDSFLPCSSGRRTIY